MSGKVDLLDDLFESACLPEDDFLVGFGGGGIGGSPFFGGGADAEKTFEVQRASLASTECPSSFSHAGLSTSWFDRLDCGTSLGEPQAALDEQVDDIFATSAMARRAMSLAKASFALAEPSPASGDEEGELPSVGAALHASGECTPCKFFRGRRGCKDGAQCSLCHHKHEELTYSGIRRMMRKKAGVAPAEPTSPAPRAPMGWRPPPGLPEPQPGAAPWSMSAAYMLGSC